MATLVEFEVDPGTRGDHMAGAFFGGGAAGVAVGIGGPGATFWMITAGLLGMSAKFTECTLGQMYRETQADGRDRLTP